MQVTPKIAHSYHLIKEHNVRCGCEIVREATINFMVCLYVSLFSHSESICNVFLKITQEQQDNLHKYHSSNRHLTYHHVR